MSLPNYDDNPLKGSPAYISASRPCEVLFKPCNLHHKRGCTQCCDDVPFASLKERDIPLTSTNLQKEPSEERAIQVVGVGDNNMDLQPVNMVDTTGMMVTYLAQDPTVALVWINPRWLVLFQGKQLRGSEDRDNPFGEYTDGTNKLEIVGAHAQLPLHIQRKEKG